ncbi:MAG: helix-turn-helix domain-containing protein [Candidatus Eisenbacteria bacterium]
MSEAAALLLENGYAGFSMRRLAERIGYSVMTIYRYFENKGGAHRGRPDERIRALRRRSRTRRCRGGDA